MGSIVNVDDATIQETIQIYGFSLIIDSVTHYPYTDINSFIHNQNSQLYLILRNVLCDPRTNTENILTSIAACNRLAGLLFVDSYTPQILFDYPPKIDLLRKNFRRVRVNPTTKQTILNIELNQRMSIRNIYPYPNKRLGHFRKFIYNLRCQCLFDVFHRK